MTLAQRVDDGAVVETGEKAPRQRWKEVYRSGWVPAALVLVAAVLLLWAYDIPPTTSGTFLAYIALAITLPGTLLWRFIHRGSRTLAEDLAAGTALGYAIEVLAYIPARAAGVPLAAQAVPLVIIVTFLAVPRLRPYWRGAGAAGRAPVAWSWAVAAMAMVMLVWATKYFSFQGIEWPSYGRPDIDLPFQLALAGEFKHHMDLVTPWVISEPIRYHWFVYADIASTSWATGIEPWVLITRLSLLPMVLAGVVLVAAFGRRVIGSWLGGALTMIAAFLVIAPNPYGWVLDQFYRDYAFNTVDDGSNLRLFLWASPSQTFGSLLFLPLMIVLLDLLREHGRDRRRWLLFALLPAAIMGAKAAFLPTLLCGLLLVLGAQLVFRRRLNRVALAALGVVVGWMAFAQLVLFGGESQGLDVVLLGGMRHNPVGDTTNYITEPRLYRLALLLLITVLCWLFMWAGAAGLRRRMFDADVLVMAGIGIAGMAALLLFSHSGGSAQGFFLMGARPYLAALATWGLLVLMTPRTWRDARPMLVAVAAGAVAVYAIRVFDGEWIPRIAPDYRAVQLTVKLVYPYVGLALVVVAAAVLLWRLRAGLSGRVRVALVMALMLGFSLPTALSQFTYLGRDLRDKGWKERTYVWPIVTEGTVEAGRWLRDNSSPDDLIATNAHCVYLHPSEGCDRRHFGIAGYTERRVLVEGWAYTARAHNQESVQGVPQQHTLYWDHRLITENDAAFTNPSPETVGRLRDGYGVRWLWVEDVSNWFWKDDVLTEHEVRPSEDLNRFATLRYRSGHVAVYEIR